MRAPKFDLAPTRQRNLRVCGTVRPQSDGTGNYGKHSVFAWSAGMSKTEILEDPTLLSIRPSERQMRTFLSSPSCALNARTVYAGKMLSKPRRCIAVEAHKIVTSQKDFFDKVETTVMYGSPRCIVFHTVGPSHKKICTCAEESDVHVFLALWNVDCDEFFWHGYCCGCRSERKWAERNWYNQDNETYAFFRED